MTTDREDRRPGKPVARLARLARWPSVLIAWALLPAVSLAASLIVTGAVTHASAQVPDTQKAAIGEIYQLQAAFHRAKTNQDIDLMMSLWAPDGVLYVRGNPNSPFMGTASLRTFWLHSPSFIQHRLSLVPSFKTRIEVNGAEAYLYFECHDVGNYDQPTRSIVGDTFLAGTLRFENGKWVFASMTSGPSLPLSPDHYYFP